jgi:hypothetical protein
MAYVNIFLATLASTADNGSSNRYKSGNAYKALAKLNLALYPPERFAPFSPIYVKSPS